MSEPILKLSGFDSTRLLCAFQVLGVPSGALGVTHKTAKAVIVELTGKKPSMKGYPAATSGLVDYLAWHLGTTIIQVNSNV